MMPLNTKTACECLFLIEILTFAVNSNPRIETQFNASDWNKRLEDYFLRQDRLLSTVEGHLAGNSGAGDK